jgi:methyltransferase (TIGR00027 family)
VGRDTGVEGGVGRTALMVAAARAIETQRPDALATDVYAAHLVRAASTSADWPLRIEDVPDGEANPLWGRLARYFGLRTRVFDDYLLAAAHAGSWQIVLLGAGLDSRAFRLDWPPGCVVFEIDQPDVLAFKRSVFDAMGAKPQATRRPIAADLRQDWAPALLEAGFDTNAPTAWLAEGVLLYLSTAAEYLLIDTVDRLSVAGSALAYEIKLGPESAVVQQGPIYRSAKQQIDVDMIALFDHAPRPDSAADLVNGGWSATTRTAFDFAREHSTRMHGCGLEPMPDDALTANRWVFAAKAGDRSANGGTHRLLP